MSETIKPLTLKLERCAHALQAGRASPQLPQCPLQVALELCFALQVAIEQEVLHGNVNGELVVQTGEVSRSISWLPSYGYVNGL